MVSYIDYLVFYITVAQLQFLSCLVPVSLWPLTKEARIHALLSPSEMCSGQSGTGTFFSLSSLVFYCHYHSILAPHTHTSCGE